MKKIKRIIAILTMAILLFCSGCGIVKGYKILKKENCCKIGEISKDYQKNNSISQKEFEIAMKNFKNSDGEYSDDYGGCFIDDDGIYNICVVNSTKPLDTKHLKYKKVDNSYKTLISICEKVKTYMEECGIWEVGICEICNKVNIGLENKGDIDILVKNLERDNLYKRNTLQFYISKNFIKPN